MNEITDSGLAHTPIFEPLKAACSRLLEHTPVASAGTQASHGMRVCAGITHMVIGDQAPDMSGRGTCPAPLEQPVDRLLPREAHAKKHGPSVASPVRVRLPSHPTSLLNCYSQSSSSLPCSIARGLFSTGTVPVRVSRLRPCVFLPRVLYRFAPQLQTREKHKATQGEAARVYTGVPGERILPLLA